MSKSSALSVCAAYADYKPPNKKGNMKILIDGTSTNIGDAIVSFRPLLKFCKTLLDEGIDCDVTMSVCEIAFGGELIVVLNDMVNRHCVQDIVNLVDFSDVITDDYDLYIANNCGMPGYLYRKDRHAIRNPLKVVSGLLKDCVDSQWMDQLYDTGWDMIVPNWVYVNEVYRRILKDHFNVVRPLQYSFEASWGEFAPNPTTGRTMFYHISDGWCSSDRWTNDQHVEFIQQMNTHYSEPPELAFIVHGNEATLDEIERRIPNTTRRVEGSLMEIANILQREASVLFTHSTGTLHLASAFECRTVELSSNSGWHCVRWCPPLSGINHFVVTSKPQQDIDIPSAAAAVATWLEERYEDPMHRCLANLHNHAKTTGRDSVETNIQLQQIEF